MSIMKHVQGRVNNAGIEEIRLFLEENHRLGSGYFTEDMLSAWAEDAEFKLFEGNPAIIEISPWDCVHGRTLTYTISDDGLDYFDVVI